MQIARRHCKSIILCGGLFVLSACGSEIETEDSRTAAPDESPISQDALAVEKDSTQIESGESKDPIDETPTVDDPTSTTVETNDSEQVPEDQPKPENISNVEDAADQSEDILDQSRDTDMSDDDNDQSLSQNTIDTDLAPVTDDNPLLPPQDDDDSTTATNTTSTPTTKPPVTLGSYTYTVDSLADENDGDYSSGNFSLREAIELANTNPGDETIGFNIGTPNPTIMLSLGTLRITSIDSLHIDGLDVSGYGITIDGQGLSRVIEIASQQTTVVLSNLQITGGSAAVGGGLFSRGTLTIEHSLFYGNTATDGAGITIDIGGEAIIKNSTISSNTALNAGGGLLNFTDTLTVINCTIAFNISSSNSIPYSAGIYTTLGLTINNTIVAGNEWHYASAVYGGDIFGTVTGTHNLIGDAATSGGLSNGVNGNIVGNNPIDSILESNLSDNGGYTKSHALVASSAAINAGANLHVTDAALTTDQRGHDFDRIANSTVDIGAFEHP